MSDTLHPNRRILFLLVPILFTFTGLHSQSQTVSSANHEPWSTRIARSFVERHPGAVTYDSLFPSQKWNYEQGLMLVALLKMWHQTGEQRYFDFVRDNLDRYVREDGSIATYRRDEFTLDNIAPGRVLLEIAARTGIKKFALAADTLRAQLAAQPRTHEGGFWHKKIYPFQMWLDGLFMAGPFYAAYAKAYGPATDFDDITNQFLFIDRHTRDSTTGLRYHAWDESGAQRWADPHTGTSPIFWGRAMGWYAMGLVDVLDDLPADHKNRPALIAILKDVSAAILRYQDKKSGLWYQVMDQGTRAGNYLEASASCMFVYALAKGAHAGYLDQHALACAQRAFEGITSQLVSIGPLGYVDLEAICQGAGLGGTPYRDGSYDYYIGVPRGKNDMKGYGAFLLAAMELEQQSSSSAPERGKRVLLDYFYNNEWRSDSQGHRSRFHYVWDDTTNSGFSQFGAIISHAGGSIDTLASEPSAQALRDAALYIIVDPDTPRETDAPNYVSSRAIETLVSWVKNGGTLLLLGNDKGNAEFSHFNALAERFGVHFNEDSRNRVQGNDFMVGTFDHLPAHPLFKDVRRIYIKELSTLRLESPATPILTDGHDVIMAMAHPGKGMVFALGDPWLYNEYMDARKLPAGYDNAVAAKNLITWLLKK